MLEVFPESYQTYMTVLLCENKGIIHLVRTHNFPKLIFITH